MGESKADRAVRLKREAVRAELEALDEELCAAAEEFLGLPEDGIDAEEMRAAITFCRQGWHAFEVWRTKRQEAATALAERRPYLALAGAAGAALLPATPQERRRPGTGSVQRTGNGYQWRLRRKGKTVRSRTWPTYAEAEIELGVALGDPTYAPVQKDRKRLTPTAKHRCSRCRRPGHNEKTCPTTVRVEAPLVFARLSARDSTGDAEERPCGTAVRKRAQQKRFDAVAAAAPTPPATPIVEEAACDEGGWSAVDAVGRQRCLVCVEGVDMRPGEGQGMCCLNCDGEAFRAASVDAANAARAATSSLCQPRAARG